MIEPKRWRRQKQEERDGRALLPCSSRRRHRRTKKKNLNHHRYYLHRRRHDDQRKRKNQSRCPSDRDVIETPLSHDRHHRHFGPNLWKGTGDDETVTHTGLCAKAGCRVPQLKMTQFALVPCYSERTQNTVSAKKEAGQASRISRPLLGGQYTPLG